MERMGSNQALMLVPDPVSRPRLVSSSTISVGKRRCTTLVIFSSEMSVTYVFNSNTRGSSSGAGLLSSFCTNLSVKANSSTHLTHLILILFLIFILVLVLILIILLFVVFILLSFLLLLLLLLLFVLFHDALLFLGQLLLALLLGSFLIDLWRRKILVFQVNGADKEEILPCECMSLHFSVCSFRYLFVWCD